MDLWASPPPNPTALVIFYDDVPDVAATPSIKEYWAGRINLLHGAAPSLFDGDFPAPLAEQSRYLNIPLLLLLLLILLYFPITPPSPHADSVPSVARR